MESRATSYRSPVFIVASVAAIAATIILNAPMMQYESLGVWVRILCPLFLFSGIYGSAYSIRSLRLLGWLGIGLFILCAMQMILPGEDYMSGGPDGPPLAAPRLPSHAEIGVRLVIFVVVTAALIYGFWRIRKIEAPARE